MKKRNNNTREVEKSEAGGETTNAIFKVEKDTDGISKPAAESREEFLDQLKNTFGIKDNKSALALVTQLAAAHPSYNDTNGDEIINQITPLMAGIGPKNELEGLLVAQMVAVSQLNFEMLRKAGNVEGPVDVVNAAVNRVAKLSRTFVAQAECLAKIRSQGKQTIRVEKVEVGSGGQAIVGSVDTGGGRDGK